MPCRSASRGLFVALLWAVLTGIAPSTRAAAVTPITLDNSDSVRVFVTGSWTPSTYWSGKYEGANYLVDGNTGKGTKSVRFTPSIPAAGRYGVMARWPADTTGATNVPITITHAGGVTRVTGSQRRDSDSAATGHWYYLGTYDFAAGTSGNVLISNAGTTATVSVDAVRFSRVFEPDAAGLPLVFSDEFSAPFRPASHGTSSPYHWSKRPAKWFGHIPTDFTGYGDAWFGVTSDTVPFSVADGVLSIRAWYDTSVAHWRSGTLASVDPLGRGFSQRYGYFVARMKFPSGMGHFPAFWLLTKGGMRSPVTQTAELDVVENYGGWPTVAHYGSILHPLPGSGGTRVVNAGQSVIADLSADFHDYGVLIEPDFISFFIDGVLQRQIPTYTEARHPFYLLVTYALGSGWPLTGVADPSFTHVDYVRVYALPSAQNAGEDVGAVGVAGWDSCAGGVHTVVASGADIWGAVDAFRFVNHSVSGDATLVARVVSLGYTHAHAKAGLMFRESTAPGSKHAAVYVKPLGGGGTAFERRTTGGGQTVATSGAGAAAYWLKLTRAGDAFTAFASPDGLAWTQLGTAQTVVMARDIYVGLAVTSHANAVATTATFDHVALDAALSAQDLGSPAAAGTYSATDGVHTLTARGADFWGARDHGHVALRPFIGDGTLTARVTGLAHTHAWAKAGVMMRASADEKSPHAFMLIPGAANASFQRRVSMAAGTAASHGPATAAPGWVRLVREGDVFTGYHSADGVAWTQVGPAATIPMPKTILVGLALTAHDDVATATATFDRLTITSELPPLAPAPSPFQAWLATHDLGALVAATDDADGDGLANLIEYAFASAPDDFSSAAAPVLSSASGGSGLVFTFPRVRAELTYVIEHSVDLVEWLPLATNPGAVHPTEPVVFTIPPAADPDTPRRFFRLKVNAP